MHVDVICRRVWRDLDLLSTSCYPTAGRASDRCSVVPSNHINVSSISSPLCPLHLFVHILLRFFELLYVSSCATRKTVSTVPAARRIRRHSTIDMLPSTSRRSRLLPTDDLQITRVKMSHAPSALHIYIFSQLPKANHSLLQKHYIHLHHVSSRTAKPPYPHRDQRGRCRPRRGHQ